MKKCLLSVAMLMAGAGAWAQDAPMTDEEKANLAMTAITYKYQLMAGNILGYPLNTTEAYREMSEYATAIESGATADSDYEALENALNLFYAEDEVLMPEDGKAYKITAICDPQQSEITWDEDSKTYLPKGQVIDIGQGEGAEFVCKITAEGKYLFVSDNGYYFDWEANGNPVNTKQTYDSGQLFTLEKANLTGVDGAVNGIEVADLLGKFCLKANNGHYLTYNVKTPAPYTESEAGSKHYNTTEGVTSFFILTEVTDYTTNLFTVTEGAVLGDTRVATFYSPNYATTMPSGYKAYWAESVENNEVTLRELTDIPANTAVVITGNAGENLRLSLSTKNPQKLNDNKLFGFSENKDVTSTDYNGKTGKEGSVYTLANGASGDVAFYRYGADQFAAGKAYLNAEGVASSARSLVFNFGGDTETAIESIEGVESAADAVVYDLAGRRVQGAQKGLYIVNGKVVIK